MQYQYVLFDFDGTIINPKEGITKSIQFALEHFNIMEDDLDNLTKYIGPPLSYTFANNYQMNEADTKIAMDKYRERFGQHGMYECYLYDGIKPMLEAFANAGITMAIASSKPTYFVEKICEYLHISSYFAHMVGCPMDGSKSEKDEIIAQTLNKLKVATLEQAVMVGDRKYDMEGAHKNHLKAIGAAYGFGGENELKEYGADAIVNSVSELHAMILPEKIN